MKIFILLSLFLVCHHTAFADYLEVRRNTGIKAAPHTSSNVIYYSTAGELFTLLDSAKQTNGYYHIVLPNNNQGWVYCTMVRLHRGDLPSSGGRVLVDDAQAEIFGYGQVPAGYYNGASTLTGVALRNKLHSIIRDHKVYAYDDAWDILMETDKDPQNSENVILLYTMRSQLASQRDRGARFDYETHGYTMNDSWNREHVWPKSHGFPDDSDTAYTDLHHLRPADRSVNSARNTRSFDCSSDIYFDNGQTIPTECRTSSTAWTWEPPDEVKGDVARMIFYMAIRYEGPDYDLEIVDEVVPNRNNEPVIGKLSTLLEWHRNDPVDNWERRRNYIIYEKYQGNRNPFIDFPHWVEMIWVE